MLIPINRWLALKIGQLSTDMMMRKDARVKVRNLLDSVMIMNNLCSLCVNKYELSITVLCLQFYSVNNELVLEGPSYVLCDNIANIVITVII